MDDLSFCKVLRFIIEVERCMFFANAETITAITLAKKTVGRPSADLSADKMPDFSSFFIGRQKINYNYLVIIFFPSADSFGVLAIGRCHI